MANVNRNSMNNIALAVNMNIKNKIPAVYAHRLYLSLPGIDVVSTTFITID